MGIPTSHADLLDRPLPAALTTHFAGGRLQSSVVWFWRDDDAVCLSTMAEFVKATNLRERPRATLAVWDADGRWLALRSAAEEVRQPADQALADCDDVGFRYCGVRPYFGAVVPAEWASAEHPVTFRLTPGPVSAGTFGGPAWTAAPDEAAPPPDDDAAALPADHLDLLTGPSVRWLATRDPDGGAHVLPAVCSFVGGRSLAVCPTSEQADDLACDPRATLLVVDRANTGRWLEVRADAALGDGRAVLTPRRVVADAIHP